MNKQKENYVAPVVEIIEMENEGVIAGSAVSGGGALGGYDDGGEIFQSSAAGHTRGYSSSSELEDMINDILTFEE